jgi:hypothetical protein
VAFLFVAYASGSILAFQDPPGAASAPTLATVLKQTAAYVAEYQAKLGGIVAEERYRQRVINSLSVARPRNVPLAPLDQARELKSDVLLVRLAGDDRWIQFRDVFEVDGEPVRDRDQRLYRLFLEPTSGTQLQAQQIQNEGARYNIGPVFRTINVPILALIFVDAANQSRFRFKRVSPGDLRLLAGYAREPDIWAIDYRETSTRTLIRGESDRDLPSTGRVWIDSTNGRVLKTEIRSGDTSVRAQIAVTYRSEPGLELLVPGEMKEMYLLPRSMTRIEGTAVYSRFRQFKVVTTEKTKQHQERQ